MNPITIIRAGLPLLRAALPFTIIGLLCLWVLLLKADVRDWKARHDRVAAARTADHAVWREAAATATATAVTRALHVERSRQAITERTVHEIATDLHRTDDRYQRLLKRVEAAKADPRGSGNAGVPALSDATCRIVAGTSCERIPALLKAAQDNTDLLIHAQHWMRAQAGFPEDGEPQDPEPAQP